MRKSPHMKMKTMNKKTYSTASSPEEHALFGGGQSLLGHYGSVIGVMEANDLRLTLPAASLSILPKRLPRGSASARTQPTDGRSASSIPVAEGVRRESLEDFFARRRAVPARDGSRYDTFYRPETIAAAFLCPPCFRAFHSGKS